MYSPNLHNDRCIATFCNNRTYVRGSRESRSVLFEDRLVTTENIYKALSHIWAAWNDPKCLDWLDKHAGLHPILMCERAIALFVKSPKIETIIYVSIPLITTAYIRMQQDEQCVCNPVKEKSVSVQLLRIYLLSLIRETSLQRRSTEMGPPLIHEIISHEGMILHESKKQATQLLQYSIDHPEKLPSPLWVGDHYQYCKKNSPPLMKPSGCWNETRRAFSENMLENWNMNLLPAELQETFLPDLSQLSLN